MYNTVNDAELGPRMKPLKAKHGTVSLDCPNGGSDVLHRKDMI